MNATKYISFILLSCVAIYACREKFVPQLKEVTTDFLVVDGYINSGAGATTISLSRSTMVNITPKIVRELKASVRVEAKNAGTFFTLAETSPGVYTHPQLTLNPTDQYRINIQTANGKMYMSDYSMYRRMPDIDSLPWKQKADGVEIWADSHDDNLPVGYYQIKYDQSWEIRSSYLNFLEMAGGHPAYKNPAHKPDSSIYTCWRFDTTYNSIKLINTENLVRNRVFYSLVDIPAADEKLSVRYSMFVKITGLSKNAYRFLEQLKKNTESLGSIFDAQPSDNYGNMHCVSVADERVIGFVEISEEKTKRLFINNSDLKNWNYDQGCGISIVKDTGNAVSFAIAQGLHLVDAVGSGIGPITDVYMSPKICVDCTVRGSNKKPSFW